MVHQRQSRADFGVIGYGRFGRFAAGHLARRGQVAVWDERFHGDPGILPEGLQESSMERACRARVVLFCVPIRSLQSALERACPLFQPGTLVADTASVKVWPCRWLLHNVPPEVEILGTHPLFGPDSAGDGIEGHKIAIVPLRLKHPRAITRFLTSLGLEVLTTTAEEHDSAMAETQSLVHWLGRALEATAARPHALDTMGYRKLLEVLGHVVRDSWELFVDLQRYNPYAAEARARLLKALAELDREVTPPSQ